MRIEFTIHPDELHAPHGLEAGPIRLDFNKLELTVDDRVRCVGIGHGIAYVFDGEVAERDNRYHISGDLQVSGTLAGLGQREVELHVRRLVSSLAGVP